MATGRQEGSPLHELTKAQSKRREESEHHTGALAWPSEAGRMPRAHFVLEHWGTGLQSWVLRERGGQDGRRKRVCGKALLQERGLALGSPLGPDA